MGRGFAPGADPTAINPRRKPCRTLPDRGGRGLTDKTNHTRNALLHGPFLPSAITASVFPATTWSPRTERAV